MEAQARSKVPAGSIETVAGRIVADGGYGRLLAALDEAHEVNDHVAVTLLGGRGGTWAFFTGDHMDRDGAVHIGGGAPIVVKPDSTVAYAHGGLLTWCGGHTMPDGSRKERFNLDGVALTLTWQDANAPGTAPCTESETQGTGTADVREYETERDVLRASLEAYGSHEAPTAREVLELQIRDACARQGLPKPDFNHWPGSEMATHYFSTIDD